MKKNVFGRPDPEFTEDPKPEPAEAGKPTFADTLVSGPTALPAGPPATPLTLEQRIEAKKTVLMALQDQLRRQIDGVANQIYVLDQLLNPVPEEPLPDESPEESPTPPRGII